MTLQFFSTSTYPTYAALKRAQPTVRYASRWTQFWLADIPAPFVIGWKPNTSRTGIRTKKNRALGKLRPRGRRYNKHIKD